MRTKTLHSAFALLALLLAPALVQPAAAQGRSIEYVEATSIEASGLLGAILARSSGSETTRSVHVLGTQVRTDDGSSSMIFDAGAREWTILLHDTQNYMTFSMGDVQAMTEQLMEAMREGHAMQDAMEEGVDQELEASLAELEEALAEAQRTVQASVEHVATGQTRQMLGHPAERHHIIVTVEGADDIQGAEDVEGGALVLVLDLWLSRELARENPLFVDPDRPHENPIYQALMEDPETQEWAEQMALELEAMFGGEDGDTGSLTTFAMVDPRVGAAMGEALEALAQMDGEPVVTATTVAVVPPTVEMDTDLILAWEPESMGDQIRGEANEAAREAAASAAREAISGLTRGFLGRRGGDDEEEAEVPEEELIIRPLFRMTTELVDVRRGGEPTPDMFVIPEGYTPLSMPQATGEPGGD
jgi:hypothetical protein